MDHNEKVQNIDHYIYATWCFMTEKVNHRHKHRYTWIPEIPENIPVLRLTVTMLRWQLKFIWNPYSSIFPVCFHTCMLSSQQGRHTNLTWSLFDYNTEPLSSSEWLNLTNFSLKLLAEVLVAAIVQFKVHMKLHSNRRKKIYEKYSSQNIKNIPQKIHSSLLENLAF